MRASEWRVLALRLWMWDMVVQSTIYKSRREFQAEIRADGSGTGDPRHPDTNPYPMVTKDGTAQLLLPIPPQAPGEPLACRVYSCIYLCPPSSSPDRPASGVSVFLPKQKANA